MARRDDGSSIAIDTSGSAYITGYTYSTDFPTLNAFQGIKKGSSDAFVTKLNYFGNNIIYSTYLGGDTTDYSKGIAVDDSGATYIAGRTSSANFPTHNPYQGSFQGIVDVFVTKLNSSGSSLDYSTYLGGSGADYGNAIAIDAEGAAYLTGHIFSTDFPTANPYQNSSHGSYDAFVTKLSPDISTDISGLNLDNLPSDFILSQNYPNPFNPSTTIEFNLPKKSNVTIKIYNLLGQEVQTLVNQQYSAGNYRVEWDGKSSNGVQTSSGIYLYRLETDSFSETKKMLLLK